MLEFPHLEPVLPEASGTAKTRVCPMCNAEIYSGLELIRHIKLQHPSIRPYKCEKCEKCDSTFNNLKEMNNHKSVEHRAASSVCKFCDYKCTTKARMRQHARIHSKGLKCMHCPKTFPSVGSLRKQKHTLKHTQRQKIECADCDNLFLLHLMLHTGRECMERDMSVRNVERDSNLLYSEFVTWRSSVDLTAITGLIMCLCMQCFVLLFLSFLYCHCLDDHNVLWLRNVHFWIHAL